MTKFCLVFYGVIVKVGMKILVVDDDQNLANIIKDRLEQVVHVVDVAYNGKNALGFLDVGSYDLVILDLVLPDMDGVEICKRIRQGGFVMPVLMLSVRSAVEDKIKGLDVGADDYLPKPFSFDELESRVRALGRRRSHRLEPKILTVEPLSLDFAKLDGFYQGKALKLRRKEFLILEYLMRHQGLVVGRQTLIDFAWDASSDVYSNTVDVHVKALRDKIDRRFGVGMIETVHGSGYRLVVESVGS